MKIFSKKRMKKRPFEKRRTSKNGELSTLKIGERTFTKTGIVRTKKKN